MGPESSAAPASWRALVVAAVAAGVDETDARRIGEDASGWEGADWLAHRDAPCRARARDAFTAMVRRRLAGEPLQYVLGHWAFRSLDLLVDRRVLIPRPETEQVVEVALTALDLLGTQRVRTVADLGTGSGAIALALVSERARVEVWATDASVDALDVARANLAGAGGVAARVQLAPGSWFTALPDRLRGELDLVVSNPPYVGAAETLPGEVSGWEPAAALVPGATGLEAIAAIVAEAPSWLRPPGVLVLEIGAGQGDAALALAGGAGFTSMEIRPDLAGRPRALVAGVGLSGRLGWAE